MGRRVQPICPRCGEADKAPGKSYCASCCAAVQRDWRRAKLTTCACGCGQETTATYARGHVNRGKTHPTRRVSPEHKIVLARVRRRRWERAHPEAVAMSKRLRRALVRCAEAAEYVAILLRDPCVYCGGPGGTVEHIVPVVDGGTGAVENLASACGDCNRRKNARPLLTFLLARAA